MNRGDLAKLIEQTIKKTFDVELEAEISVPEAEHGDFATNVAFRLANIVKKPPREVAEALISGLSDGSISSMEVAGAGYINIRLSDKVWIDELSKISETYARKQANSREKIQVEFISANPTGPLTLGNSRGGFLGDVVANVLKSQGFDVTKEYYFNDAGTQIGELLKSIRSAAGIEVEGDTQYRGQYIEELADKFSDDLDIVDDKLAELVTEEIFAKHIKPALDAMGVKFDVFFNERDLKVGFKEIINILEEKDLIEHKDDATWLKSTGFGDERDRVLVKANGDTTYLGNDIAYHQNIFKVRNFDKSIKIWGADHIGQVPSLKLTINKLFADKDLDFIIVQWVRLIRDGKEVKISKRAGTFVTVQELIDEVGPDVARFFFLQRSNDSQMDFDLDLAKEHSQKNPYYYVMYSYARASSILRSALDMNLEPSAEAQSLNKEQIQIVKKMAEYPDLLEEISRDYAVHKLSYYAYDLAKLFTKYYETTKIIALPANMACEHLFFVSQYQTFMNSLFEVMGIEPQSSM